MTSPRGLVWPLLLITLGVVLLLANVGVIGPISLAALASLFRLGDKRRYHDVDVARSHGTD